MSWLMPNSGTPPDNEAIANLQHYAMLLIEFAQSESMNSAVTLLFFIHLVCIEVPNGSGTCCLVFHLIHRPPATPP